MAEEGFSIEDREQAQKKVGGEIIDLKDSLPDGLRECVEDAKLLVVRKGIDALLKPTK